MTSYIWLQKTILVQILGISIEKNPGFRDIHVGKCKYMGTVLALKGT